MLLKRFMFPCFRKLQETRHKHISTQNKPAERRHAGQWKRDCNITSVEWTPTYLHTRLILVHTHYHIVSVCVNAALHRLFRGRTRWCIANAMGDFKWYHLLRPAGLGRISFRVPEDSAWRSKREIRGTELASGWLQSRRLDTGTPQIAFNIHNKFQNWLINIGRKLFVLLKLYSSSMKMFHKQVGHPKQAWTLNYLIVSASWTY